MTTFAQWPPLVWPYLKTALLLALVSLGFLLATRSRRAPTKPTLPKQAEDTAGISPLAIAFLACAIGTVGFGLGRFQYVYDDFRFLFRAWKEPFLWDESMRLLTTNVVFWIATSAPEPSAAFMAVNGLGMASLVFGWALLLRNAGSSRSEALIAGGLLGMTPYLTQLVRRASGIENIAAVGWLIACTLVFQWSARLEGRRKLAAIGLLASMTMLGCFVKFPVLAPLPAWLWLWSRWDRSMRPLGWRLPAALGALLVLGIDLGHATRGAGGGLMAAVNLLSIASNARHAAASLKPWASDLLAACLILVGAQAARSMLVSRKPWPIAALREFRSKARSEKTWLLGALALGAVALAPSLVNGGYYANYYVLFAMPALSAIAARALHRLALPGWAGIVPGIIAAALFVPISDFAATYRATSQNRAAAWVGELAATVRAAPEPARLALQLDCPAGKASPEDEEDLWQLYLASGERDGIGWATGWKHTDVIVLGRHDTQPKHSDLVVGYCPGQPLRVLASPSS